jgi:hypothetical protein
MSLTGPSTAGVAWMTVNDFTGAVAAAAAAGAMSALEMLPASKGGSAVEQEAFHRVAQAAASAAAAYATSLLPSPLNEAVAYQQSGMALSPAAAGQAGMQSMWQPGLPRCPPVQLQTGEPNTIPAHHGEAPLRTTSDGSAHVPGGGHDQAHQAVQQTPQQIQQDSHMDGMRAAESESPDSESADGLVTGEELGLIRRLQLYAWLVRPNRGYTTHARGNARRRSMQDVHVPG